MTRLRVPLLACVAALLAGAAQVSIAATDPSLPGPFIPGLQVAAIPATQGAVLTADVHYPDDGAGGVAVGAGPCPVVVFGHGFSRSRARYADFGRHLASRGFVVIVPDFRGLADHSRNADDLSACVDWILAQDADASSIFYGRIDAGAIGASGHSAGGMSALVALARDPRLVTAAPMDPVDDADLGSTALAGVRKPVAITYSEDSSCNASGSARTLYAAARPPKRGVLVVGANHCDPEMPSDFLCTLTCGAANAGRQALYLEVVTGWLEMHLRCDPGYEPWVSGAQIQADVSAGLLAYQSEPDPLPPPCVAGARPEAVTGLRAVRSGNDVVFTWDALTADPAVTEYRVLRDSSPLLPAPVLAGAPAATRHDDLGLVTDGATWFVQIRAVNSFGEGP